MHLCFEPTLAAKRRPQYRPYSDSSVGDLTLTFATSGAFEAFNSGNVMKAVCYELGVHTGCIQCVPDISVL